MTLCAVVLWRWPNPVRDSVGQHDNILRLSFRGSGARDVRPQAIRCCRLQPSCGRLFRACYHEWCGRWESNPHSLRNGILNPARLPIPPRPRCDRHITSPPKDATENIKNANYVVSFMDFFRTATGLGRTLRTLTAEASILFFKCRP